MLDETLWVIDRVRSEKLKMSGKPTVNRYLALMRAILYRARDEWEWIDGTPKVKFFREGAGRERSISGPSFSLLLSCPCINATSSFLRSQRDYATPTSWG